MGENINAPSQPNDLASMKAAEGPPAVDHTNIFRSQPHSHQTPIRIIQIGAGAAGLLTAFKAQKNLENFQLVVYEKNSSVGGTWVENKYPGCACDVPAHSYTFSFEANPNWSGFYVGAEEIRQYMENFADKYDLRRFMCFNTTVLSTEWDETAGEWIVDLQRADGTKFVDRCNVIINGSGPLNKWKWPMIPGRTSFKGQICHSSNWDPNIDWTNKNVGVIGCGASGVQVTPPLTKGSKSLTLFARSIQWITPPLGYQEVRVPGVADNEASELTGSAGKHRYTEAEKKALLNNPVDFLQYRKNVDQILQRWFSIFLRNSPERDMAVKAMSESIRARFGPDYAELAEHFVPNFSPGCRRNTPGEGFIEAITQKHVTVIKDEIETFTEDGIMTKDGRRFPLDLIVCATGFDVAYTPHFRVKGIDGKLLREAWAKNPQIYLTMATPGFPNFFHIGGPTGNWGSGCILASHETQVDYAIQACQKISSERLHSIVPKVEPTRQYMEFSAAWHKEFSVWAEGCRSWYKNHCRDGGEVMLWCGSMLHMMKTLRSPRWEDYEIMRRDGGSGGGNMWAFLGLGKTQLELEAERGLEVDLSPFIRLNDYETYTIA
ncbi:hypothetical protein DL764_002357 [Monosporascus ibericus]|uniref:FAD/NAD(P)-binding domain-containing protein n=1 Tax=Monosporascus ibericus TaxID=155417 RepID=A0A4Q4TKT5_9PEZI|nr:hypothetical protein DL764_002357 [Monosporascus ibericus]